MITATRQDIINLAKEYVNAPDYHWGFITNEWIDKVKADLKLDSLKVSDVKEDNELNTMWHLIWDTLSEESVQRELGDTFVEALDARSAFLEVVNLVARRKWKDIEEAGNV